MEYVTFTVLHKTHAAEIIKNIEGLDSSGIVLPRSSPDESKHTLVNRPKSHRWEIAHDTDDFFVVLRCVWSGFLPSFKYFISNIILICKIFFFSFITYLEPIPHIAIPKESHYKTYDFLTVGSSKYLFIRLTM